MSNILTSSFWHNLISKPLSDVFYAASYSGLADFTKKTHRMFIHERQAPNGAEDFFKQFKKPLDICNAVIDVSDKNDQINALFEQHLEDSVLKHPFYGTWLADVRKNCELLAEMIKDNEINLSLDTLAGSVRFHNDGDILKARLLCTYKGPGTEWLKTPNVNLRAFNNRLGNEDIVRDKTDIQQTSPWDVAVFDGGDDGIFHRSPEHPEYNQSGEMTRICLRINNRIM
ncbi:MAG: DUF1826 domain-containing protein [Alphaproteobacteria bacterium]|nr:hypothetical protein [Alphaproteobacteria bacterium]MCS5597988.1 DUF1826 domain-containing protein [Alphaproteobacteria bacterium]